MSAQIHLNQLVHMSSMLDFSCLESVDSLYCPAMQFRENGRELRSCRSLKLIVWGFDTACGNVWMIVKQLSLWWLIMHSWDVDRMENTGKLLVILLLLSGWKLGSFVPICICRVLLTIKLIDYKAYLCIELGFYRVLCFFCTHFAAVCQHICSFFKLWVRHDLEILDVDPSFTKPNAMVWLKPDKCYQKHLHYYFHEIDW